MTHQSIAIPTRSFRMPPRGLGSPTVQIMGPMMGPMSGLMGLGDASGQILRTVWGLASLGSMGTSAYYNYRRTDSAWSAFWSAMLGGLFPVIAPAITVAKYKNSRKRS